MHLVASFIRTCKLIECTGGGENEDMLRVNAKASGAVVIWMEGGIIS